MPEYCLDWLERNTGWKEGFAGGYKVTKLGVEERNLPQLLQHLGTEGSPAGIDARQVIQFVIAWKI